MAFAIGQPTPWPVPPDWGTPPRETLAWLTDYMAGRNGTRQKRQLRLAPRRTFEFNVLAGDDSRRLLDALRFDQGTRQWLLPIWPDVQQLAAQVDLASSSIACATAGRDFVAGGSALLWSAINHWELLAVDTVTADGLTLTTPTAAIWPAGTRLYPLRTARWQDAPEESLWSDNGSALKVTLLIDEPCDFPAVAPSATYRGVPVLEWRGDESGGISATFDRAIQTVDGDTGAIDYLDLPATAFRTQSHAWQLFGRDEHTAFRSLLYWLRGRMGTLWVPSFASDLRLAADIAAAATTISVQWAGNTVFGRQQANRRDIRIELQDGSVLYRRITGSSEAGSTEILTLDSALGADVAAADVRVISFLTLAEQAADSISIDHRTDADGVGLASMNWAGIVNDL